MFFQQQSLLNCKRISSNLYFVLYVSLCGIYYFSAKGKTVLSQRVSNENTVVPLD